VYRDVFDVFWFTICFRIVSEFLWLTLEYKRWRLVSISCIFIGTYLQDYFNILSKAGIND